MSRFSYWHVRMMATDGTFAPHPGWIVNVSSSVGEPHEEAMARVRALGLDNGDEGEWGKYPELTADVVEFNPENGVAEL